MAVTIVVLAAEAGSPDVPPGPAEALSLSLDAPRLVIGRGDGCEIRLPDPSVSARHASIRQRGAEYMLVDEGSLSGTFIGRRKLPPHTPEPLRDGDRVRVGRVWLMIRISPAIALGAPAAAARELALALVTRGLRAQGEDPTPYVQVLVGPDEGQTLLLEEAGRPYTVGRARDVDLPVTDQAAARRQLTVTRKGDQILVRNVGAAGVMALDGAPLPPAADVTWRPGQSLTFGATRLACELPAVQALAELERCPDEPLRGDEPLDPPDAPEAEPPSMNSGSAPDSDPPATPAPPSSEALGAAPTARLRSQGSEPAPPRAGWGLTDAAVLLLALGVLAVSIAGLSWLFGRG